MHTMVLTETLRPCQWESFARERGFEIAPLYFILPFFSNGNGMGAPFFG